MVTSSLKSYFFEQTNVNNAYLKNYKSRAKCEKS